MSKKDWIQVCQDTAEALGHMHALGILHNDLKNNNVLVHNKMGYVIDLGKACHVSSPPAAKKYNRVYNHIAPEVLNGECFRYESDIYSLGIIFNFIRKYCQVFELRNLEKDCLNLNYVMRPTANIVTDSLKKVCVSP